MIYLQEITGSPSQTVKIACTDAAQLFSTSYVISGNLIANAALITCEDNDVRFTLGDATPTQGAAGVGHVLYTNQSIKLHNSKAVKTFKFINYTNAANAIIQVTFEF